MEYYGTLEDLKEVIRNASHNIVGTEEKEHCYQIRTQRGAVCNWYPNTGTLQFQGDKETKEDLQRDVSEFLEGDSSDKVPQAQPMNTVSEPSKPNDTETASKKVFVVHGHDTAAREQLELILHKLDMQPFVLANTSGEGLTIIEALEKEIGPGESRVRFGIVLLTPDDMGYAQADGPDEAEPRARQNVVLEMGMLISALGRQNVAILKKGHIEVPSDAQGVLYIPFNEHVKETVPKLVDRLRSAGFNLPEDAVAKASM